VSVDAGEAVASGCGRLVVPTGGNTETITKLARLTDEELVRLDELLDSDREGARQFWRQRFGEELPDAELVEDDRP